MLPNLVIIGAMKAGTSALHYYLDLHPDISMSTTKELDFFLERNWTRGVDWYEKQFDGSTIRGESSPNYTAYPVFPGVAERMHSLIPDAKLIYLVRDPVDRMVSHYQHSVLRGLERRTVDEALLDSQSSYYQRSRYFMQISRFLRMYGREAVSIVSSDELRDDRAETLQRIFRFLGVDDRFHDGRFDELRHVSSKQVGDTALSRAVLSGMRLIGSRIPVADDLRLRVKKTIRKHIGREAKAAALDPSVRATIAASLSQDVNAFRDLAGRDLWAGRY